VNVEYDLSIDSSNIINLNLDESSGKISANLVKKINHQGQNHYYYEIKDIDNYKEFKYTYTTAISSRKNSVIFPKTTSAQGTKIIGFGDIDITGLATKAYLSNLFTTQNEISSIAFLGDIAYDLHTIKSGTQIGNEFMNIFQEITSSVPFQVKHNNRI